MNEELQYKIEQYLDGTLPKEEVAAFEKRMLAEEEVGLAVREELAARVAIEQLGDQELKNSLLKRGQESFNKDAVIKRNLFARPVSWLSIAAAIALLLSLVFLLNQQQEVSLPTLYAQHETEIDISFAENRGKVSVADSLWNLAGKAYEAEDYQAVILIIDNYLSQPPADSNLGQAYLFKGISLMKLDRPKEAIEVFSLVPSTNLYTRRATWYTALAYLQADDLEGAKESLTEIAESSSHFKRKEAAEILNLLE
ncbi:MAG: hypothetical protein AAGD28_22765 [Bacteroidota bacterium]